MAKKIGEHFIGLDLLSFEQCEEVLKIQNKSPKKKFGEIAVALGYLSQQEIDAYIEKMSSG